ncbi:MAG: hypothetical protein ACRDU0_11255 [Mycobacterium sp.]
MRRALVGFGRFWWEFLVGDTPELTVGILLVLGLAAGLGHRAAAFVALPLAVACILALSVRRASRPVRAGKADPPT